MDETLICPVNTACRQSASAARWLSDARKTTTGNTYDSDLILDQISFYVS